MCARVVYIFWEVAEECVQKFGKDASGPQHDYMAPFLVMDRIWMALQAPSRHWIAIATRIGRRIIVFARAIGAVASNAAISILFGS